MTPFHALTCNARYVHSDAESYAPKVESARRRQAQSNALSAATGRSAARGWMTRRARRLSPGTRWYWTAAIMWRQANSYSAIRLRQRVQLGSSAAIRMEGQVSVFSWQDDTQPCYRCISRLYGGEVLSCCRGWRYGTDWSASLARFRQWKRSAC